MFESFGVINYYNFIIAVVAIILLPGPNSIYVLTLAGSKGIKAGYKAALGIFLGDAIIMLVTALGAASILKSNPILFSTFEFAGAIYLAYLGLNILIGVAKSYKLHLMPNENILSANLENKIIQDNKSNFFKTALCISLINPKAILFFLAFFVQFINQNFEIWQPFIILGVTLQIISFLYLSLVIFAGKYLSIYFKKHIFLSYIGNIIVGFLFIFFSYKIFSSSL